MPYGPESVVEACNSVLRAYTSGRDPDPATDELFRNLDAERYAQACALEAFGLVQQERGTTADLLFTDLVSDIGWRDTDFWPLLRFVRARLVGHTNVVLRLEPDTAEPTLMLLMMAGHALLAAADASAGTIRAEEMTNLCLDRLNGDDPLDACLPTGDMWVGFSDAERHQASNEDIVTDQMMGFFTGTVPLRSVFDEDGSPMFALDLAARPDIEDLVRILATDAPRGGADTATTWSVLPLGPSASWIRLSVQWLEPVRTDLGIAMEYTKHAAALRAVAEANRIVLTGADPEASGLDAVFHSVQIETDGDLLRTLLNLARSS